MMSARSKKFDSSAHSRQWEARPRGGGWWQGAVACGEDAVTPFSGGGDCVVVKNENIGQAIFWGH